MPDISIIAKGGVVMVILIAMSIYALSVIIYKVFQFIQMGVFDRSFINPVMEEVKDGELTAAENKLQAAHGPIATVMKVAIVCVTNRLMSQRSREAEISRVGSSEIRRLETHMRGLELVAMTSPLLGLLGTVMGMVTAFAKLGEAGSRVDPSMLAGGIWEALLTTVGGLVVAVPAIMAYYILDGIIEKVRATMNDVTVQILALEDEFLRNEKEQERRQEAERRRKEREEELRLEAERRRKEKEEERRLIAEQLEAERRRFEEERKNIILTSKAEEERLAKLRAEEEARLKALREEEERKLKEIEETLAKRRSRAEGDTTLKLLSPSYKWFK